MTTKAFLLGVYLGQDPELKKGGGDNGKEWTLAKFSVASNRKEKGEKITDWWEIECWNNPIANNYLKVGQQINVIGELVQNKWKDKETGKERKSAKIVADYGGIQLLGKRDDNSQPSQGSAPSNQRARKFGNQSDDVPDVFDEDISSDDVPDDFDDDIPFE